MIKGKKAKENLNEFSSNTLFVPFAKMNSVSRLDMAGSAFKHMVVPCEPEYPLVDSAYTNDILLSTDNMVENNVEYLAKVEKVLNGVKSETTYFYRQIDTGTIKLVIVPEYTVSYKYGYPMESDFEKMKPGEVSDKVYTIKHKFLDTDNNIVSFGKNVQFIYSISKNVGEDSIIVTESLAHRFRKPHIEELDFLVSPDHILRNLYGDKDTYKPLPLPGDVLKDGLIAVMYVDDSKSFLSYDDGRILDTDNKIMIQFNNARVIDMEVYAKDTVNIPGLETIRQEYRKYMYDIVHTVYNLSKKYGEHNIHHTISNLANKYQSILNNVSMNWDIGTELKSNVGIKYKLLFEKPLEVGDKLTNRHGAKGTISAVVPDYIYAEDGTPIEMFINLTGIINRENPAQLYERELNTNWMFIQKYLNKSTDSNKKKKEVILKWLTLAMQPDTVKLFKDADPDELVEYYKINDMVMTYQPYDDPNNDTYMNWDVFSDLVKYTKEVYPEAGAQTIFYNGEPLSEKHMLGKAFYIVLSNGPSKATSIRGDDGTNSKGSSTKIGKDRKKHSTKYGTTAVKKSDLALNITINPLFDEDKSLLRNNTKPVHDYMHLLGRELIFEDDDTTNEYSEYEDEDIDELELEESEEEDNYDQD